VELVFLLLSQQHIQLQLVEAEQDQLHLQHALIQQLQVDLLQFFQVLQAQVVVEQQVEQAGVR
jgi:hypothetical protein